MYYITFENSYIIHRFLIKSLFQKKGTFSAVYLKLKMRLFEIPDMPGLNFPGKFSLIFAISFW